MDRPTKRDTKGTWIEYADHLEKSNQVGDDSTLRALELEMAALKEHRNQLLRTLHTLRSRKG